MLVPSPLGEETPLGASRRAVRVGEVSRIPDWLGLSEKRWVKTDNEEIRPAKTAWDWLQLLVVPVALAALAIAFNSWQSEREAKRETARANRERNFAEEARLDDTLQSYLGQMSELVLDRKLLSSEERSEVQVLARTLTLTTLERLDGGRKREVLQYLGEAGLATGRKPKVRLTDANLFDADLSLLRLDDMNLSHTLLFEADFGEATLKDMILDGAQLYETSFKDASLSGVSLQDALVRYATFDGACLFDVRLNRTDLTRTTFASTRGDRIDFTEAKLDRTSWGDAKFTRSRFTRATGARPPGWEPGGSEPLGTLDRDGDGDGCD
jgi:uncharacterized protein YjbI with pentapeptide repeats